jgi:hypothetical protein
VTQQSKNIIPLPGNDSLNEEQLATKHAFETSGTGRGFYDDDEPARDPVSPPFGVSS